MHDDDNFDDYISGLEAWEILRPASDCLLQMIASGRIDLNGMAREEFRARRRHEAEQHIAAMAGEAAMNPIPGDSVIVRQDVPTRIIHGDCINVMRGMDAGSVDFILTDPPYLVNYRDRSDRSVTNDDNDAWLFPAYEQMYRVLKQHSFCVTFYGWHKADLFIAAWKQAGFRIAGHIVFRKAYASSSYHLQYRHEQAYLLVKGRPPPPSRPPPDVMDWSYTGNKFHPTQKSLRILRPLIEAFCAPGGTVLDPFCGSGSTLVAARELGRHAIGIEIEAVHHRTASERLRS